MMQYMHCVRFIQSAGKPQTHCQTMEQNKQIVSPHQLLITIGVNRWIACEDVK